MAALTRFDPMRELMTMREAMDRLMGENFFRPFNMLATFAEGGASIPLDMYEEGNTIVVKATIPGIKPEDLKVEIRNDMLTISGETREETEKKEATYHMREQRYGKYERMVALPAAVLADKAEAVFENGMLTLKLPKTEEARTTTIPVKAKTA
jgi:HSP20 family protein